MKSLQRLMVFLIGISVTSFSLANNIHHLRNERYCEVFLLINPKILQPSLAVYNTLGLNNCPANLWNKLSLKTIKQKTGTSFAHLNGPRYWVIDGMRNSSFVNPTIKNIGGISMRLAGILDVRWLTLLSSKPYSLHTVKRNTTWIYEAGKPIYELIDPKGRIFVMQSYSIEKIPQNAKTLPQLASNLTLPKDWRFRSRILEHAAYLTPQQETAIVVQDNFLNTYQQETPQFISESSH